MTILRLALISVHASPLAPMGGSKTGGLNVYIRKLAQEFGRRGIEVDIFTRRSSSQEPYVDVSLGDRVRVVHITAGPRAPVSPEDVYPCLSEFSAGVLAFTTRQNISYDIIYSHYWLSGWVAHKLREIWGIPFVQMFHTLGHMKNRISVAALNSAPNQRIRLETEITQWADRIIAATPAEYAQLRWLYRADRRKIEIVPPGVDLEQFHPASMDDARRKIGLLDNAKVLLFVGRIEPLKAIDTVIQALAIIRQEWPDLLKHVRFIVVGGDPADCMDEEMNRLKQMVSELQLTRNVNFVGAKDQDVLADYYVAASVVILPSDYESFGMAALEAMATATPVIATDVGGLAYLVKDGETGYLVPSREPKALADKIVSFLDLGSAQIDAMQQAAHDQATHYAWSTVADQLLQVFDNLLRTASATHHKS